MDDDDVHADVHDVLIHNDVAVNVYKHLDVDDMIALNRAFILQRRASLVDVQKLRHYTTYALRHFGYRVAASGPDGRRSPPARFYRTLVANNDPRVDCGLQAAIDEVSKAVETHGCPLGLRLLPGHYHVAKSLVIKTGVHLFGSRDVVLHKPFANTFESLNHAVVEREATLYGITIADTGFMGIVLEGGVVQSCCIWLDDSRRVNTGRRSVFVRTGCVADCVFTRDPTLPSSWFMPAPNDADDLDCAIDLTGANCELGVVRVIHNAVAAHVVGVRMWNTRVPLDTLSMNTFTPHCHCAIYISSYSMRKGEPMFTPDECAKFVASNTVFTREDVLVGGHQ